MDWAVLLRLASSLLVWQPGKEKNKKERMKDISNVFSL